MTLQSPALEQDNQAPADVLTSGPIDHRSRRNLWIILSILTVLGLLAAVGFAVLAAQDEPAAVNTHTVHPDEPALMPVPGYTYNDASPQQIVDVGQQVANINEILRGPEGEAAAAWTVNDVGLKRAITAWTVHEVVPDRGGVAIGFAMLSLQPDAFENLSPETSFLGDVIPYGLGFAKESTIAGEDTVAYFDRYGGFGTAWLHDGVLSVAFGTDVGDEGVVRQFVTAYLTEANK